MKSLQKQLAERMKNSLERRSIVSASRWAEKYRVMAGSYPGVWSFDHHPWLREMHDSTAESNVGQKSAQVGFTEMALNKVFFTLDVLKRDCLYLLPNTKPDASDFSTARFDKAIDLSPHIKAIFTDVNNVGLKKAGSNFLYVRGSNSRPQLKSIAVSLIVFDELDEMDLINVELAGQRMAGQLHKQEWKISTPSVDKKGINRYYIESTQENFGFACPSCRKQIIFKFPESLVVTADDPDDPEIFKSHLICYECKYAFKQQFIDPDEADPLDLGQAQLDKKAAILHGKWFKNKVSASRGFHLNQMYSPTVMPSTIAKKFLKSQNDILEEQEFFNSFIGVTHTVKDAKISDQQYDLCIKQYKMVEYAEPNDLVTMGFDVGKKIHVHIDKWWIDGRYSSAEEVNDNATRHTLAVLEVVDFKDLDKLMKNFKVKYAIGDVQPETREGLKFCNRFFGYARLCRYNHNISAKNISTTDDDNANLIISVNRTSWLDLTLGRYKRQTINIPMDVPRDYKKHIQAQIRVPKRDKDGNPSAFYETPGNTPDHYAHAALYSEVALPFAMGYGPITNSEKVT